MKKPSITVLTNDPTIKPTLDALKENVEVFRGIRGRPLSSLPENADLPMVIRTINALLDRLQ